MEKVPQIVSDRLRAASSSVGHPDPDVLTAFSEHSLRKSERAAVVEHLARCGECREVVALALPASDQLQRTLRPTSESWLTRPAFRWGFIAAGIVAIASFGVMRYQHRVEIVAYLKAPSETRASEATAKKVNDLPVAPSSTASAGDRDKATASTVTDRKDLSSANANLPSSAEMATPAASRLVQPKPPVIGGPSPHGPRVQWQQNPSLQQQMAQAPARQLRGTPLPSAPPSANTETVDVEGAAGTVTANLDSSAVQNKVDQQALQQGLTETRVERSKPASTAGAAPQRMAAFSASNTPAKPQLISPSAPAVSILWTITATGRLQRSLDRGTTWQNIDVQNSSAAAGPSFELMEATSKAKKVANDNLAKKETSAPITFRAVASNGPDVWAGASGGLLYHSTDAGGRWTRVSPSASGVSLTGDIVSLDFGDPQHGRVVTSTPEVWTTSDAGQSWQKQ